MRGSEVSTLMNRGHGVARELGRAVSPHGGRVGVRPGSGHDHEQYFVVGQLGRDADGCGLLDVRVTPWRPARGARRRSSAPGAG